MNPVITRDIITDLLPVYLSGEASADTKALIEACMKDDSELARLVKEESRAQVSQVTRNTAPDHELRALRRTKRRLRRKVWFLALAIFFTFTTFFISIENTGITWSWEVSPLLTAGLALVAALFWMAYFRMSRTSRAIGI